MEDFSYMFGECRSFLNSLVVYEWVVPHVVLFCILFLWESPKAKFLKLSFRFLFDPFAEMRSVWRILTLWMLLTHPPPLQGIYHIMQCPIQKLKEIILHKQPLSLHCSFSQKNFSLRKYLLRVYYVPGTVLDIWDTSLNRRNKDSYPHGVSILSERGWQHKIN